MTYRNLNHRISRCLTCEQPVTNAWRVKSDHTAGHDWERAYADITPEQVAYWRSVRRDALARLRAAQHNTQDNATDVRYNRDGPDGCVNTSRSLTSTTNKES